jgi:hypothetical protein
MRWRQVVLWWVAAVALAVSYGQVQRRQRVEEVDPRAGRERLLRVDLATLAEVAVEERGQRVVARRADDGWIVDEPPGMTVPSDLVAAFVRAVVDAEVIEQVAGGDAGDTFGLGPEAMRIELRRSGGAPETVWLGAGNPTGTAVYARHLGRDGVLLVGRTLRYYADLIVEALPKPKVPPDTTPGKVGLRRPLTIRRPAV